MAVFNQIKDYIFFIEHKNLFRNKYRLTLRKNKRTFSLKYAH